MIHDECKKILVCTPSNKAVDEILSRISNQGLIGTEVGEIVRIGSSEYQAEESIKHHSLDQRVNAELNSGKFTSINYTLLFIEKILEYEGESIIQIIKDLSQEFFHTTSKRMKISSESS